MDRSVTPAKAAISGMVISLFFWQASRIIFDVYPTLFWRFTDALPTLSRCFTDVVGESDIKFSLSVCLPEPGVSWR